MNKFIAMIILKPDIKNKRIDNVQNSILNMFEQNTKVQKIWYLGKKQLDFKNKKYNKGRNKNETIKKNKNSWNNRTSK